MLPNRPITENEYGRIIALCRHERTGCAIRPGDRPIHGTCADCLTVPVSGSWEPSRVAPPTPLPAVTAFVASPRPRTETEAGSTLPPFVPPPLVPAFEGERSGVVKALAWGMALGFGVALWYLAAKAVFGVWR